MRTSAAVAAISSLLLTGCHTITEELPTRPSQEAPSSTISIPLPSFALPTPSPAPTPRPTPTPAPGPNPAPAPTPGSPTGGTCTNPDPGPVTKIEVKVHIYGANRIILDTTPMVGPDAEYCKKIGFTDGRRYCPPRPEGHPERGQCDGLLMGRAKDTGRIGPTWTINGAPCVYEYGCENHPENQFLSFSYKKGLFEACAESGVCGGLQIN